MNRTLTAMYRTRDAADRAAEQLRSMGVSDVQVMDPAATGDTRTAGTVADTTTHEAKGLWASIKELFVPDEDAHIYSEGVRRGNVMLTASTDDSMIDRAHEVLDRSDALDVDAESETWRQSGWTDPALVTTDRASMTDGTARRADDRVIPIVEEQLAVGKRDVTRGGARVRSYVVEKPASEDVTLREEHVSVERRPVNQPLDGAPGDLLRERVIEVAEHAEEAIVGKRAFVTEEVRLRTEVGERVEHVQDSVRHTEVEVTNLDRDRIANDDGEERAVRFAARDVGDGFASGTRPDRMA